MDRVPMEKGARLYKLLHNRFEFCLLSAHFPSLLERAKLSHLIFIDFPFPFLSWDEVLMSSEEEQAWLDS